MRWKTSSILMLAVLSTNAWGADPVGLLLRALAPLPLNYNAVSTPFETYQNRAGAPRESVRRSPLVQEFVFEPQKFDDLAARYELWRARSEQNATLQLLNGFETQASNVTDRVMREYLRRIYQGYSTATTEDAQRKQKAGVEGFPDVVRNLFVNYQSFHLGPAVELRAGFDVVANSSHLKLVTPLFDAGAVYYSLGGSPMNSVPEHVATIDEAFDQYATFNQLAVTASRTFRDLGLRVKTRYGVNRGTLDYGFSKTLVGPLAVQLVREDAPGRELPGFVAVQLTVGKRF